MRGWMTAGFLLVAALGISSMANADGMRCGVKLVSDGDSMYQVQSLCGRPDQASQRTEKRTVSRWVDTPCTTPSVARCGVMVQDTIDVQVDEWLYDFGPNQFVRTLVFESGHLIRIVTGGYGVKQT